MARDNRTLKLSILADVDDLKKKLGEADKAVETNSSKIAEFGKKAAAAFAVAAAAAVAYGTKLAVDGVKAAIEDEQAQLRLANALRQATGATDAQIKATEDMILKTSLATGVADDKLRPALQRLAVSTKSTEEAQKLLTLALDISAASGKDLETVSNALGRAQDGNQASLGRLGLGLSKAELATLSFTEVQAKLAELYGGAAATNAETFQGKIDRLKVGFDEAKESLGTALLPAVEQFITFLNDKGIPTLNGFIAGLTGDQGLSAGLAETQRGAESFGRAIGVVAGIVSGFITFLREAIGLVVSLANELIRVVNIIPGVNIGSIANPAPSASRSKLPSVPSGGSNFTYGAGNPAVTNIYVSAIDGEGAARAVAKVVNDSAARSVPLFTGNGIRLQ
jgi:tetrahydromethanopterin S-methyltransferase subunit G